MSGRHEPVDAGKVRAAVPHNAACVEKQLGLNAFLLHKVYMRVSETLHTGF